MIIAVLQLQPHIYLQILTTFSSNMLTSSSAFVTNIPFSFYLSWKYILCKTYQIANQKLFGFQLSVSTNASECNFRNTTI